MVPTDAMRGWDSSADEARPRSSGVTTKMNKSELATEFPPVSKEIPVAAEAGFAFPMEILDKSEDFTQTGSFDWDLRANTIKASVGMHRLLGIAPGTFDGRPETIISLVHPEDRTRIENHVADALRGHAPTRPVEFRICRNGEMRHVWVHGEIVCDEAGEAVRGIGAGQDITERKHLEDRLYQSEKMDAIGRLAGGIALDFNNMLGPILGYADLLVGQIEDDELRRFAENISRAARRAADLTTQLLGFARKSNGEMKTVDIHDALDELVTLLKHTVDRRIVIDEERKVPRAVVTGDRTQLHNMLLNLALNARDAMPDGGTLLFSTNVVFCDEAQCRTLSSEMLPGDYVTISVTDTGVGMAAPTLKRIFEPFFTTKPKGKGTGMGLASTYGTARSHRGAISVTSTPGEGSTFTVYLPVGQLSAKEQSEANQDALASSSAVRVMVVDDEDDVRTAIADLLQLLGYSVTAFKSGSEALRTFRASPDAFDVIFLDTTGPGFSINDTVASLRSARPEVKILLSSAYGVGGKGKDMPSGAADEIVEKPYTASELARKIEAAIAR